MIGVILTTNKEYSNNLYVICSKKNTIYINIKEEIKTKKWNIGFVRAFTMMVIK